MNTTSAFASKCVCELDCIFTYGADSKRYVDTASDHSLKFLQLNKNIELSNAISVKLLQNHHSNPQNCTKNCSS